jgi:hypothetical protein
MRDIPAISGPIRRARRHVGCSASGVSRTSSRAISLLGLCWALAAATASAQDLYYLHAGGVLSQDLPPAGGATVNLPIRLSAGADAVIGTFTTAPLEQEVTAGNTRGVAFLGTGRPGMDGCARVTMEIQRLSATVDTVASGSILTTIASRRRLTDPIFLPMALLDQMPLQPSDRLIFQIRVKNECGGERTVSLLYDSSARPSRVELALPGTTTTTTSTTTTSTTTTLPPSCIDTGTGLAGVRCRLEAMDDLIRATSPAALGGVKFERKLSRKVVRALKFVRAAELIEPTPKRLKRAHRQLDKFTKQLQRGLGKDRVDTVIGGSLSSLAAGSTAGLDALLAGG